MRRNTFLNPIITFALALALPLAALAQSKKSDFEVANVKTNGTIKLDLAAGNYEIVGTDNEAVKITYDCECYDGEVKVTGDTNGQKTHIKVMNTPHEHFHARIEVPRRQNLLIDLTAGNIHIKSVKGNKMLSLNAGNAEIEVGDPDLYGRVEARVLAGNIEASPFGVNKSGLWRSFERHGSGEYALLVHLLAGNVRFYA